MFAELRKNSRRLIVETNLDELGSNKRWIAKVVQIAGYHCKLQLMLTDTLQPVEFWVNWGSMDVQPEMTEDELREQVSKIRSSKWVLETAGYSDQLKMLHTERLRDTQRVEVLNSNGTAEVRPARVKNIIGNRVWLNISSLDIVVETDDNGDIVIDEDDVQMLHGIFLHVESPMIFPVGWKENPSYEEIDAGPEQFAPPDDFKPKGTWKEGYCLEVLDPLEARVTMLQSLRAAYVKKVLSDGYLEIAFECGPEDEKERTLPIHSTSALLFPPGYAEEYGIELVKPNKESPWHNYINQWNKGERFHPEETLFHPVPSAEEMKQKFPIGAKLEVADLSTLQKDIYPAEVRDTKGRIVVIAFDGYASEFDQMFHHRSPYLNPLGWCEMVGNFLVTPPKPSEQPKKARRPSTNRTSEGSAKKRRTEKS
uniref:Scm-like with four mbt domains 1 n=1 Tax=Steinernema glaseri TaxID=37863 RepID=A0A1I7ZA72_9BILA